MGDVGAKEPNASDGRGAAGWGAAEAMGPPHAPPSPPPPAALHSTDQPTHHAPVCSQNTCSLPEDCRVPTALRSEPAQSSLQCTVWGAGPTTQVPRRVHGCRSGPRTRGAGLLSREPSTRQAAREG